MNTRNRKCIQFPSNICCGDTMCVFVKLPIVLLFEMKPNTVSHCVNDDNLCMCGIHTPTHFPTSHIFVVCHLSFVNWLCFFDFYGSVLLMKRMYVILRYHLGISMSFYSGSNPIYLVGDSYFITWTCNRLRKWSPFYPNVASDNRPSNRIPFLLIMLFFHCWPTLTGHTLKISSWSIYSRITNLNIVDERARQKESSSAKYTWIMKANRPQILK